MGRRRCGCRGQRRCGGGRWEVIEKRGREPRGMSLRARLKRHKPLREREVHQEQVHVLEACAHAAALEGGCSYDKHSSRLPQRRGGQAPRSERERRSAGRTCSGAWYVFHSLVVTWPEGLPGCSRRVSLLTLKALSQRRERRWKRVGAERAHSCSLVTSPSAIARRSPAPTCVPPASGLSA